VSEQITIRKGGFDIAEIEKEMTELHKQLAAAQADVAKQCDRSWAEGAKFALNCCNEGNPALAERAILKREQEIREFKAEVQGE
jgi:hypothetical protein